MVACGEMCVGIHRDQTIGSLPRCLVLEMDGRAAGAGCVIIGINPGRASERERSFYREHSATYDAVIEWFKVIGVTHRYYTSFGPTFSPHPEHQQRFPRPSPPASTSPS